jgi:transaldolase
MQAELMGCHVITMTPDLLSKAAKFGMDLECLSLDTVKMFYSDARKSGFKIS